MDPFRFRFVSCYLFFASFSPVTLETRQLLCENASCGFLRVCCDLGFSFPRGIPRTLEFSLLCVISRPQRATEIHDAMFREAKQGVHTVKHKAQLFINPIIKHEILHT